MRTGPHRRVAGLRSGAVAIAPILVGVAPVGVVAGATPVAHGMPWDVPVGFSTILFAGASQLAAIEVLTGGGTALVAVITACTMNLRMAAYSASLAPEAAGLRLRRRLVMAYLLTDEAYAAAVPHLINEPRAPQAHWILFGAGFALWAGWQVSTLAGVLLGAQLPDNLGLDFALPLTFIAIVVPLIDSRAGLAAALAAGVTAVLLAGLHYKTGLFIAALAGLMAGALSGERRR